MHYFGIQFYEYSEYSLQEACELKGLNESFVIKKLEYAASRGRLNPSIQSLPIDIVLAYLIHSHHYFVNERLPLLVDMIDNIEISKFRNQDQASDLKLIFPLVVEEFIEHIHEEENTLFKHIESLLVMKNDSLKIGWGFFSTRKKSISDFAIEHAHEDEMEGVRILTNSFKITEETPFYEQQLITELQMLDNDFKLHAKVEDEILFPKALELESEVRNQVSHIAQHN